jgi:hypothetical protein
MIFLKKEISPSVKDTKVLASLWLSRSSNKDYCEDSNGEGRDGDDDGAGDGGAGA